MIWNLLWLSPIELLMQSIEYILTVIASAMYLALVFLRSSIIYLIMAGKALTELRMRLHHKFISEEEAHA